MCSPLIEIVPFLIAIISPIKFSELLRVVKTCSFPLMFILFCRKSLDQFLSRQLQLLNMPRVCNVAWHSVFIDWLPETELGSGQRCLLLIRRLGQAERVIPVCRHQLVLRESRVLDQAVHRVAGVKAFLHGTKNLYSGGLAKSHEDFFGCLILVRSPNDTFDDSHDRLRVMLFNVLD